MTIYMKKQQNVNFFLWGSVFLLILLMNPSVNAQTLDENITELRQQWAKVNYQLKDDPQLDAFEQLAEQVEKTTKRYPDKAEAWIWSGIIKSSFAGKKGGLGALSLAKSAKKDLEKALKLDANALKGSAYTSLGTLYFKLPGWPLSFGSDKKAAFFLKKALKINPQGKEPNYFYGEYLYDDDQYEQAQHYLLIAQSIPARENSLIADKYRQEEIAQVLAKVNKHLKKH
jgi:tetratricopeptide (TPR) repeat protein